ncbi:MAG: hypothetical protein A3J65_01655 [Candidatus Buchananbacteria bacterium RIFCSPHIGHO2_02_FULL_45_11b]|uniref:Antitoxin n=4 Tax=Candidatus Buchananiibacteriota TaxID=1817903 RepID=A0A1G1YE41_9BACT|nr:MAG: hypothetical protein A2663_01200 [Candidatus Buchananbacteria bacterium RIFCSPHIGHO2_01_FULL_46_12]OGY50504.1 MAG: hypothetical protein A3J65_01655 [Candidatus Buchananbacteria bacterium RIFCSPHIGHO2_02_FULL_45_11b]OGY53446.1 MAG: hypothetical protein A3B15_00215 [Candidatus Buchananbacteria bacterium RIFCSPLOWO2_01_FULL_45_31]OGY57078.1 MAG: hypothetical protein A3H67_05095 [Candidatus Buchananbacteria bacterium RIFCSPLOWO2_02_FULL_46_11b]
MSESIKKIISLINKTGDNCVVLDEAGNPAYVIMPISRYESLISGPKDIFTKQEKSLIKANNDQKPVVEEDNYFFEPID